MASETMSDERLAEIRRRWNWRRGDLNLPSTSETTAQIRELLAEVERLRAREVALTGECIASADDQNRLRAELLEALKIVRGVATGPHWAIDLYTLQEQARALLATEPTPAE